MRIFKMMALAIAAYFTVACAQEGTTVSGTLEFEIDALEIYAVSPRPEQAPPIDTFQVNDGSFEGSLVIDSAEIILVKLTDSYSIPLFVNPDDHIKLTFTGTLEDPDYQVSGSHESERMLSVTRIRDEAFKTVDSLNEIGRASQGTEEQAAVYAELDGIFQATLKNTTDKFKALIDEEPGSIANIFIFSQAIGNVRFLSADEDLDYFIKVDTSISKSYPNLSHTKVFNQSIKQIKDQMAAYEKMNAVKENLAPGADVPEIDLATPDGGSMKLSELRGKLVLIDFWASWCRPCRAQNPFLVNLYNNYKDQGFDVYSVSLDGQPGQQNAQTDWTNAIAQDGLAWQNHVSDLKGWESEVIADFGFQGIPFTVLIDRDGKIIATELHGPELEEAVKKALGA